MVWRVRLLGRLIWCPMVLFCRLTRLWRTMFRVWWTMTIAMVMVRSNCRWVRCRCRLLAVAWHRLCPMCPTVRNTWSWLVCCGRVLVRPPLSRCRLRCRRRRSTGRLRLSVLMLRVLICRTIALIRRLMVVPRRCRRLLGPALINRTCGPARGPLCIPLGV